MKVRAKRSCFHGGSRRRPGEVFQVEDGMKLPEWMEAVDESVELGREQTIVQPQQTTMSEIAHKTSPDLTEDDIP